MYKTALYYSHYFYITDKMYTVPFQRLPMDNVIEFERVRLKPQRQNADGKARNWLHSMFYFRQYITKHRIVWQ